MAGNYRLPVGSAGGADIRWMLDVRCWMFDVGAWILDVFLLIGSGSGRLQGNVRTRIASPEAPYEPRPSQSPKRRARSAPHRPAPWRIDRRRRRRIATGDGTGCPPGRALSSVETGD